MIDQHVHEGVDEFSATALDEPSNLGLMIMTLKDALSKRAKKDKFAANRHKIATHRIKWSNINQFKAVALSPLRRSIISGYFSGVGMFSLACIFALGL